MRISLVACVILLFALTSVGMVSACEYACTPGYWKNHLDSWVDYEPTDLVCDVYAPVPAGFNCDLNGDGTDDTLLDALKYHGGSGIEGAQRILLKIGTAALLSEAALDDSLINVRTAVSGRLDDSRDSMLAMAFSYDFELNNAYCPLD